MLVNTLYRQTLKFCQPDNVMYEIVSSFNFNFLNYWQNWTSVHNSIGHFSCVVYILWLFFLFGSSLFCRSSFHNEVVIYFRLMNCKYFLPVCSLFLPFFDGIFGHRNKYIFTYLNMSYFLRLCSIYIITDRKVFSIFLYFFTFKYLVHWEFIFMYTLR